MKNKCYILCFMLLLVLSGCGKVDKKKCFTELFDGVQIYYEGDTRENSLTFDQVQYTIADSTLREDINSVLLHELEKYPADFFVQLTSTNIQHLVLIPCASLTYSKLSSEENGLYFEAENCGYILLQVADDSDLTTLPALLHHEISHCIDRKMESSGEWDEEAWLQLQPEGFTYQEDYENTISLYNRFLADNLTASADSIYFVDHYSTCRSTEDRARIFETIMSCNTLPTYMQGEHMRSKIQFYFAAIRRTFDVTNWEEKTYWEEVN